ncbi:MAG TPA: YegS/Rv2252/BmrU family lipid kinase [Clostridiaceae bacterium]|nr:YegS/Rv2252/BmrU family lipid kinase [Clostridiaceae bacterium]
MLEKAFFIYNPLSGNRAVPLKLDYIINRFFQKDILLIPYRISDHDHGRLMDIFEKEDFSRVIVSGGDGTISSVVNLLLKNNINLPIGIIPSGTCNDLARSLEIPHNLKNCLDVILEGHVEEIDAGLINEDTYFLNTCAGGIFVEASYCTSNELKKNLGALAYYLKALDEVTNIKPFKLTVQTESDIIDGEFLLFLILNGKHVAGFNNIVKKADLSDGLMDILLVKNCLPLDIAGLFFKVLSNDFLNDRNVIWLKTKSCTISGSSNVALSIDGEKGSGLPISIRFINKAVKVFTGSTPHTPSSFNK